MPFTFDNETGDFIPESRPLRVTRNKPQQGLGWILDGAGLWEFFHPGTVQDEYAAVGARVIPSRADIQGQAVDRMITTARDDASATFDTGTGIVKLVVLGLVAFAVIEIAGKLPAPKQSLRGSVVKHYRRRAARAISRRIAG